VTTIELNERVAPEFRDILRDEYYLPSFQISAASFLSLPIFSHTTRYLPVISCGVGPLVLRLKVPISRAAEDPSGVSHQNLANFFVPRHLKQRAFHKT
jgi:hypothetical protein